MIGIITLFIPHCVAWNNISVLLKKNKASLEEMTQKHREIAELNKVNEAKLFQTKIGKELLFLYRRNSAL